MATWAAYLAANRARFQDELLELLRIPSISSLPEHAGEVERAARWVADRLRAAGAEGVKVLPTRGHPVVYGEWLGAPGKPTLLLYGHFDTQPVDPLALWSSPPFEPVVRDGRVYARGSSDMKGNLLMTIIALEAHLRASGSLPFNVKYLFEGEEEIGSPNVPAFLETEGKRFAADLMISADGSIGLPGNLQLPISVRGLAGLQIDVRGATTDLHSGLYGGAVENPIRALARLLASMHDAEGRVLVEGFYDDVAPLSSAERAEIAAAPFDEATFRASIGVPALVGEPGYTAQERIGARPTLEFNGIWGGFQGEGTKTVLPNEAHAKITCRLVPNQEPDKVVGLIEAHVRKHAPAGVTVRTQPRAGKAMPYHLPADHPANQTTKAVISELFGQPVYFQRMGGSIAIVELIQRYLGVKTATMGFSMDDEKFHAPDEFMRLENYERGQRAYATLLERLGRDFAWAR